jgi:hypothetical protein
VNIRQPIAATVAAAESTDVILAPSPELGSIDMADSMLQFHSPDGVPDLDSVLAMFGLAHDEVNCDYGVVGSDLRERLYVILVKDRAVAKVKSVLAKRAKHAAEGLFGNARIEPTGPQP